jgi:RNA polymerase sigma-70 factor (ECF subfamily)
MPQDDKNNLRVLYENHARELSAFVRQRIGAEEAADVVHETYLRVLQYADQSVLENPRAYLYRVAANVATDCGVALKTGNERFEPGVDLDSLDSAAPGPEAAIDARRHLQRCLAALDELPAVYRHVFLLHRIDGLTQGEIAGALDIPKRTVERYIAKALEHCLKRLGHENG